MHRVGAGHRSAGQLRTGCHNVHEITKTTRQQELSSETRVGIVIRQKVFWWRDFPSLCSCDVITRTVKPLFVYLGIPPYVGSFDGCPRDSRVSCDTPHDPYVSSLTVPAPSPSAGETEKPCSVILINDLTHEPTETLRLVLSEARTDSGPARLGDRNSTELTISDTADSE